MASRADQMASSISFAKFSQATDLKKRLWFTLGALIVFRFLSFVPLPGIDPTVLSQLYAQTKGGILDIFNTFSGDRKSVVKGKSVSVSVDLGGRRLIHKNITQKPQKNSANY